MTLVSPDPLVLVVLGFLWVVGAITGALEVVWRVVVVVGEWLWSGLAGERNGCTP